MKTDFQIWKRIWESCQQVEVRTPTGDEKVDYYGEDLVILPHGVKPVSSVKGTSGGVKSDWVKTDQDDAVKCRSRMNSERGRKAVEQAINDFRNDHRAKAEVKTGTCEVTPDPSIIF